MDVTVLPLRSWGMAVEITESYSEVNQDGWDALREIHPTAEAFLSAVGQSFLCNIEGNAISAKFYLLKQGSPTGHLIYALYNAILNPEPDKTHYIPDGLVPLGVTNTLDVATLTTSYALYELTFTSPVPISGGQHYAIVVQVVDGSYNGTNRVKVGNDSTDPTHDGNTFDYSNSAWISTELQTWDNCFYVYEEGEAVSWGYPRTKG